MMKYTTKYTSHNLYKAFDDPRFGWQVARIRFQEEMRDDGSLGFFIRSYKSKTRSISAQLCKGEKNLNIFDGCPNTKFKFASDGPAMQSMEHWTLMLENALDGFYNKETAVAVWKELVAAGFTDCFSTVCNEVDEKYRVGA